MTSLPASGPVMSASGRNIYSWIGPGGDAKVPMNAMTDEMAKLEIKNASSS